jgi:hypothetical protein
MVRDHGPDMDKDLAELQASRMSVRVCVCLGMLRISLLSDPSK